MANSAPPLSCNDRPVFSKSLPQINAKYNRTENGFLFCHCDRPFLILGIKKTVNFSHSATSQRSVFVFNCYITAYSTISSETVIVTAIPASHSIFLKSSVMSKTSIRFEEVPILTQIGISLFSSIGISRSIFE